MRESALWKAFSRCVPPDAMAARIENSLESGMPDVLFTYRGRTVLIELKTDSKISNRQSDWALRWRRAGGKSFFLLKTNRGLYFVPGYLTETNLENWRVRDCHEVIRKIGAM